MEKKLLSETKRAIRAEKDLVKCYHEIIESTENPRIKSVMRDMILLEEMNELFLRSLNYHLG